VLPFCCKLFDPLCKRDVCRCGSLRRDWRSGVVVVEDRYAM
jgi:hypothetical protein